MKTIILIMVIVLMFSACTPLQKKVTCSECKGKGEVTYNATERMATAKCQLYFAAHERECDKCKKAKKPACRKAIRKIDSIMEEAKKQPPKMVTEKCSICGGSGFLIEE